MRIVIIDDERLAREELRGLLQDLPGAQVVGEAADAAEGLRVVEETEPDLVLLDVSMPEQSGFDFLSLLPPPHPRIVFVTAHDAHALRAFEVNALDYLMKPVVPERLAEAYRRALERAPEERDAEQAAAAPLQDDDHVLLREDGRCWFVPIRKLRLLEGRDNHTRVWFEQQRVMLYRTLVSMEERLPRSLFLRANRSQLVNRLFIEKVEPWFSGSLKVTLTDGTEVEFSRRQAQLFKERTLL
jgi:two-component system, LytTR family, response regulator